MSSKLDNLRSRLQNKGQVTLETEFYFLAKELGCLGDILGREFEVEYEGDKIKRIIQKPMSIPAYISMMKEMEKDYRNQEKAAKKGRRRR